METKQQLFSTSNLVKMAFLGALATILMEFKFVIPIFPSFLSVDFSDIPIIVGMLTLSPVSGFVIAVLKNLLNALLFGSGTGYVGEFANLVISIAYIIPLAICLNKQRDFKAVSIAISLGVVMMAIVGGLMNYFVMIPLYANFYPNGVADIVSIGTALNSGITDLFTLILYSIIPFNLVKGAIVSIASIIFVKSVYPILSLLSTKQRKATQNATQD